MTPEPLSVRVPRPASVEIPASRDGVTWRRASLADVDAVHDVVTAAGRVDHPHFTVPREEVEEDLSAEWTDLDRDTLLAMDDSGVVLAWGVALRYPGQDTIMKSIVLGSVRPEHRGTGLGRQLARWQTERAREQLAALDSTAPGWIQTFLDEPQGDAVRLLEREGFSIARYFLDLERDLSQPVAERPLVGYEVAPFTPQLSEQTRLARNDAFRDHWSSQPTAPQVWEKFVGRSITRADLSRVALAPDGEVAGFVMVSVNPEDTEAQGFTSAYIDLVGVRREHRRRGIAPALLASTLQAAAAEGLERVTLGVDSDSPTGAVGLYEGLGFVPAHRSMSLTIEY